MAKFKIAILKNEDAFDHEKWLQACEKQASRFEYRVIEITASDWLRQIREYDPHACVLKPSGRTELFRQLYQERVDIIAHELGILVYPSFEELRIYENKKFFSYWAEATEVPHPRTWVFYHKQEALEFVATADFPLVGKKNIGASGNGVRIIKTREALAEYIHQAFSEGIVARTGPKLEKGKLLRRLWNKLIHPRELANRLRAYRSIASDRQRGYLILQEYIEHDFEWRVVCIGDSFFAHKKLKEGDKASGTLLKDYGNPPLSVLDFVYDLTRRFSFHSVSVDLFEDQRRGYLVNEIQCIFGQSDAYQMMVDGKVGRYRKQEGSWTFESGDFASNACYDLRLDWLYRSLEETLQ